MEINLNFKRVDVNAFTLKEAEEILAEKANFEKFANATQAWKNAGSPMQNTKEFKELPHGFGASVGYSMITDDIKTIDDAINEAAIDMRNKKEEYK